MLDKEARGRFITGLAGPSYTPIDALDMDVRNWLQEREIGEGHPTLAPGDIMKWDTPDKWTVAVPWRAAGCAISILGGDTASVVRFVAYTDEYASSGGADPNESIATGIISQRPFYIPAHAFFTEIFAVPAEAKFAMLLESGDLAWFENTWMKSI